MINQNQVNLIHKNSENLFSQLKIELHHKNKIKYLEYLIEDKVVELLSKILHLYLLINSNNKSIKL